MSLLLPPTNHPAREHLDVAHLVELTTEPNWPTAMPTFIEARRNVQRFLKATSGAKSATSYCLRANDEIWLIRVGPRGGWKKLWNFGKR